MDPSSSRMYLAIFLCLLSSFIPVDGDSVDLNQNVLNRLGILESLVLEQRGQLRFQDQLITDLRSTIGNQEARLVNQEATITNLEAKLADEQRDIQVQQATIVELQNTIAEQANDIQEQNYLQDEQNRRLAQIEELLRMKVNDGEGNRLKMDAQEQTTADDIGIDKRKANAESDMVEINQGKTKDHNPANSTRHLHQRLVLESGTPVAFYAVNTGTETANVGIGQHVLFDKAWVNQGAGFHTQQGLFIAPTPGLYIFSTSIMSYIQAHEEVSVNVMKNGVALAKAFSHGDNAHANQGSITLLTQLVTGDEVWVSIRSPAGASYWGESFTSFMGCLLWPQ